MSVQLNVSNFGYFAFNTSSPLLSKTDQKTALALSILMGVFTLGLGHLISTVVYVIQKAQMNEHLRKIKEAYDKALEASQINNGTVPADQSKPQSPSPVQVNTAPPVSSETDKSKRLDPERITNASDKALDASQINNDTAPADQSASQPPPRPINQSV